MATQNDLPAFITFITGNARSFADMQGEGYTSPAVMLQMVREQGIPLTVTVASYTGGALTYQI